MRTFIESLLCFLPEQYRRAFGFQTISSQAAVVSGVAETLLCGTLIVNRYFSFVNARMALFSQTLLLSAAEKKGETLVMGSGISFCSTI